MIVTFISECEKKALPRTRRVLDAFANRIGRHTWQTVITEEGLSAVKKLLRKTVTKNTAVACHRITTRQSTALVWIVGNRSKFNSAGHVPVNRTQKKLDQNKWENDWHYLPLIKALVAVSALLHDWGKATVLFQEKLHSNSKNKVKGDPLRHEWVSCLLLNALVQSSTDASTDQAWLELLSQHTWNEDVLKKAILNGSDQAKALDKLPPFAQLVAWLIVSHHRLPDLKDKYTEYGDEQMDDVSSLFEYIAADWGYKNNFDEADYQKRLKKCFQFEHGLLGQSTQWLKQIKKWSARLLAERSHHAIIFNNGSWRVILHHARLCLMLGDHYYSSCDKNSRWTTTLALIANTDRKTKQAKQYLDEHLVGVCDSALRVTQSLSRLADEMESAYDIKRLKQKSPKGYEWQDQAVKTIDKLIQTDEGAQQQGWFVVNMASTGKGKTIANAKIMQALSPNSDALRYILALGLRTLTLQTGDSYRHDIGLENDELAVLIGSKAVQELHQKNTHTVIESAQNSFEALGAASLEQLLDNELDYDGMPQADFLDALFPVQRAEKNKAFLYKPVLACTIDHIMAATETKRGGRYILPSLRLSSSDLVIDEVDDFNGQDLVAIARLVHLVGMLGRKVMISSATIPPALAEGFFNAYQKGWALYCAFKQLKHTDVVAMWVDEFKSKVQRVATNEQKNTVIKYKQGHDLFVQHRVDALSKQVVKHKTYIVDCTDLLAKTVSTIDESTQQKYFERIQQQALHLHHLHYTVDVKTGKKVSFGVIRIANTSPCVALAQFLLQADWPENTAPRVMAYHSRQVMLLRSEQERHLDQTLKRKEPQGAVPNAFLEAGHDGVIRQHLDTTDACHVIFILVATPVEEVGRDHDFDWAVIEPSSYRSIIQLAGRVLRHRQVTQDITQPNIALMQYNLKALSGAKVAFDQPGFEKYQIKFRLVTKDLSALLADDMGDGLNAIPRIQAKKPLQATKKLADLEHAVLADDLTNYTKNGAKYLNAWLNESWFLTALPQRFKPFRQTAEHIQLFAVWQNHKLAFCMQDGFGGYSDRTGFYKIEYVTLGAIEQQRLWLNRNYYDLLQAKAIESVQEHELIEYKIQKLSERYGEMMLPKYDEDRQLIYSDHFGLVVSHKK